MSDAPVRIADRYEVTRELGRGAFGLTLLARDVRLGRSVALKVLRPRAGQELKAYELFEREAQVLRELRHPAIPAVHTTFRASWEGADAACLVMEYIEGTSLAGLIAARRHFELAEVLGLFVELLSVLDYLHSRVPPVLHRDIKPANLIQRPDGSVALVDFGAVRNVFRGPEEDGSTIVGTHGYMPYEQYMGQASPASDLYALGATLLHLLTGRPPRDFLSSAGRLEVPATLPQGEPLRSVLARMLAPAQADRFQSARDARAALLGVTRPPGGTALALAGESRHEPGPLPAPLAGESLPREIRGEAAELLHRVTGSPWELMNTGERGEPNWGLFDVLLFGFFSLITAGILPAIFFGLYFSRKRRYRQFLIHGVPAVGEILGMQDEKIGFDEKLIRVRYQFEADGRQQRGSDAVLPKLAERWERGDRVNLLYRPDRNYDSIIISTS